MGKTTVTVGTVEGMYADDFRVAASHVLDPAVLVQVHMKSGREPDVPSNRTFEYLTPANARELAALLTAAADQVEKGAGA